MSSKRRRGARSALIAPDIRRVIGAALAFQIATGHRRCTAPYHALMLLAVAGKLELLGADRDPVAIGGADERLRVDVGDLIAADRIFARGCRASR